MNKTVQKRIITLEEGAVELGEFSLSSAMETADEDEGNDDGAGLSFLPPPPPPQVQKRSSPGSDSADCICAASNGAIRPERCSHPQGHEINVKIELSDSLCVKPHH